MTGTDSSRVITEEKICAFEQSLREDDRAAATVSKYGAALRRLRKWLEGRPLTRMNLLTYRDELQKDHLPQTVNGVLSAIHAYLKRTGDEDCHVPFLKVQRSVFRAENRELTRTEYGRLVKTARKLGKDRLALIMETICATGMRVSELCSVTVESTRARKARIALKGKIRTILLPQKLCKRLLQYAKGQKITSGVIFRTGKGHPLSRKVIWAQMKEICEEARVESAKVYPHNLRHLFARCFYRETHDVVKLADVLGHSSVETTRIYLISTGAEHARTLGRLGLIL